MTTADGSTRAAATAGDPHPASPADARPAPLRIAFITEDDPLYVIRFFDVFFAEYPRDEFDICAVTVQDAFHEPLWKTAQRMWRFYGPVDFMRLGLRFATVKARRRSIAAVARHHGLPLLPVSGSVNDAAFIDQLRACRPDVIVSVAAPEIFRADLLAVAAKRCVNIHSGRLPTYRGMMPNFWQMLHGEPHATVTVHEMVARLDAGRTLGTLAYPIHRRDSLHRVIIGTKREGARLMIDVLRRIARGDDEPQEIDMADAQYFSFPQPDDVHAFRRRGHRML